MKQRGTLIVYLGLALGILIALGTLYGMYRAEIKRADKAGYDRALKEVAQRDKQELLDAQTMIAGLTLDRDTQAALHAAVQSDAKKKHDKEIADAKVKTADLQRRIASGELVLRDPGRTGESCPGTLNPGGDRSGSETGTATAPADGGGQAQPEGLSKQAAGFLLDQADRADEVATDLELCWSIAKDDRARLKAR